MANQIKVHLARQLSKHLDKTVIFSDFKIPKSKRSDEFAVQLSVTDAQPTNKLNDVSKNTLKEYGINNIEIQDSGNVNILMDNDFFIKNVIENTKEINKINSEPKKIIVEYSSPNIAKPFHAGHLRSTIIGSFIANIYEYYSADVTRLNYIGDWGTQFGLLKLGVDLSNLTQEEIRADPIQCLYQAYVKANSLASTDNSIAEKAMQIFNQMERGEIDFEDWKQYKKYTIDELTTIYNRLGTTFDEYHWESNYNAKNIEPLMKDLESKGVLKLHYTGQKIAMANEKEIPVIKSDGSSLYMSRDIAAALDRFTKYNFDEMIYVVDGTQAGHFRSLMNIIHQTGSPVASKCKHVSFGRVIGMNTRKGNAVFLKDILDEAKERMHKRQLSSETTKASIDDEETTDILGATSVIINDLKQRREKNYNFCWDQILQQSGDTGIRLQYLHCRLYSIEKSCGFEIPTGCFPRLIAEEEALALVQELARFEDVVEYSKATMEACVLVVYLFNLSHVISRAVKKLQVKNQPKDIAEQRLLLFHSARLILKKGLQIVGVKVLNQM